MVPLHLTLRQHPWPAALAVNMLACYQHPGRCPLPLRLPLLLPCRGDHDVADGNASQQAAQHHMGDATLLTKDRDLQAWWLHNVKELLLQQSQPSGPHAVQVNLKGLVQL